MEKLLKLLFKLAVFPILALLLVLQLVGALLVGLSSVVTKLLAIVFIIGTVAGIAVSAPTNMIYQTAGVGAFFALAPHIATWLLDKVSDLMITVLDFLML